MDSKLYLFAQTSGRAHTTVLFFFKHTPLIVVKLKKTD
jgi:hypothetical protein